MQNRHIAFDTSPVVWCLSIAKNAGSFMINFVKQLENRSRFTLLAVPVAIIVAIGWVDSITDPEITFSVFYLAAVVFAGWFVGKRFGFLVSVACVVVACIGDFAGGEEYSNWKIPIWNALVVLTFDFLVVWLLANLRSVYGDLENQVRQRTFALTEEIAERERLERELLEISEREQRRIGHDLHDSLCQHLTGVALAGQVLEDKLAALQLPQAADAGKMVELMAEGIDLSRKLAKGLCPVEMAADGLMLALEEYAETTSELFKVACRFECDSPVLFHATATAVHLYRIAQEAVGNAIKHGKAKNILIRLNAGEEVTVLTIKDDGVGLPATLPKDHGMGLRIMAHRANMISGGFNVQRAEAGGTLVTCELRAEPKA